MCLKLDTFVSLLNEHPFWIDRQYRIHLGRFTPDNKSRPVLHFTTMRIVMPLCFKYATNHSPELELPKGSHEPFAPVPIRAMNQKWEEESAGLPLMPRAGNCLLNNGQIPGGGFPVTDASPNIKLDQWLPPFVHQIISDAKRYQHKLVRKMNPKASDPETKSNSSSSSNESSSKSSSNNSQAKQPLSKSNGRKTPKQKSDSDKQK